MVFPDNLLDLDQSRSLDRLCRHLAPLFLVSFFFYWLALFLRHEWTRVSLFLLLGGCLAGETVAQALLLPPRDHHSTPTTPTPVDAPKGGLSHLGDSCGEAYTPGLLPPDDHGDDPRGVGQFALTAVVLIFAGAASLLSPLEARWSAAVVAQVGAARWLACAQLDAVGPCARPFLGYLCAAAAVVCAQRTEAFLNQARLRHRAPVWQLSNF